jgi:hypothetical protein
MSFREAHHGRTPHVGGLSSGRVPSTEGDPRLDRSIDLIIGFTRPTDGLVEFAAI